MTDFISSLLEESLHQLLDIDFHCTTNELSYTYTNPQVPMAPTGKNGNTGTSHTSASSGSSSRTESLPRLIVYHQTHHDRKGQPVRAAPLIDSGCTHVYIAAIHINEEPWGITINDHHSDHKRNTYLWCEVAQLQQSGIKVMGMLGGAAKGSYERLTRNVCDTLHSLFTNVLWSQ